MNVSVLFEVFMQVCLCCLRYVCRCLCECICAVYGVYAAVSVLFEVYMQVFM